MTDTKFMDQGKQVPESLHRHKGKDATLPPSSASPDDLWSLSISNHYNPRNDVFMSLEVVTERQTRVLISCMRLTALAALVSLVILTVYKLDTTNNYLLTHKWLEVTNVCVGGVCLAVLLYCWCTMVNHIHFVCKRGKHWARRRAYLVILVLIELTVHTLNLTFFVADNAYVVAHECAWFSAPVRWLGFAQWTCWNTLFLVLLVLGANTQPWLDKYGRPRNNLADATLADAPVVVHAPKLILWAFYQALVAMANTYKAPYRRTAATLAGTLRGSACDILRFLCSEGGQTDAVETAITATLMSLTLFYLLVSLAFVLKALHRLQRLPYMDYRISNLALRFQLKLRAPGIAIFIASPICLALVRLGSCQSQLFIYLGMLPMQVAMTGISAIASYLVAPSCMTGDDLVLQVWLQEHAWRESDILQRKAIRRSDAPSSATFDDEPMFCFETALKMHYWSGLVYHFEEVEVAGNLERAKYSLDLAMRLYDLQHHELIWEKALDTKCLLAWNDQLIVVAFRGTASVTNAFADIKFFLTTHPPKRGLPLLNQPMVHTGFLASWLANGLNQRVVDCINRILSSKGVDRDSMKVIVTGHSLGGALATLASYDIRKHCNVGVHDLFCITFGAPRTGNHAFALDYNTVVPHTWHVVNDQDLVTRKGKMFVMYKRPGQRVLINAWGDLIVRPSWIEVSILQRGPGSLPQHHLASYREALTAICKAQFTNKGSASGMQGVLDLLQSKPVSKLLELGGLDADTVHRMERRAKLVGLRTPRLAAATQHYGSRAARWYMRHVPSHSSEEFIPYRSWKPSRLRRLDEAAADAAVQAVDTGEQGGLDAGARIAAPHEDGQAASLDVLLHDEEQLGIGDVYKGSRPDSMEPSVEPAQDPGFQDRRIHQAAPEPLDSLDSTRSKPSGSASWRDRLSLPGPLQAAGEYLRQLLPSEQILTTSDIAAADTTELASSRQPSVHHRDGLSGRSAAAEQSGFDTARDVELGEASVSNAYC